MNFPFTLSLISPTPRPTLRRETVFNNHNNTVVSRQRQNYILYNHNRMGVRGFSLSLSLSYLCLFK